MATSGPFRWLFGVPEEVERQPRQPWTTDALLYNVLLIIVAFMIVVTAIYLPQIEDSSCSSWCCRSTSRATSTHQAQRSDHPLPFQPQESKASLTQFSREKNGAASGANSAVMILENLFTGLASLSIPHKPIYSVAKLAAEAQSRDNDATFTLLHKNRFPMVTVSGKRGTAEEIYMTVYMAQTLAREHAVLILNGLTDASSPAFEALNQLTKDEVLEWNPSDLYQHGDETWISARFKSVNTSKSVSEHLYDILYRYLDLAGSSVRYYVISKEREEELRRAYKNDQTFTVTNLTTAFHAAVLKVLFPDLKIELVEPPLLPVISVSAVSSSLPDLSPQPQTPSEDDIYRQALDFLKDFIL